MRLFSSGGRWRRKRSWDDWKCLGHGGSPGTRSLHAPHPAGSPAPGEHRVGSSRGGEALPELRWLPLPALPVTRCQQQQLFQVPKVGGEGKFDPAAGTIFSQGMLCSRGLECTGTRHVPGWAGCCLRGAGAAPWAGGGLSLPQSCGFSCKAHGASGWESRSLQDPFSKRFRLAGSLIDCLID